ncbi:MAG: hypothetical protein MZW92_76730 [Comamonadaceae bacterium]|nr:hypothetical protein [Comamonadaceae bacterium]
MSIVANRKGAGQAQHPLRQPRPARRNPQTCCASLRTPGADFSGPKNRDAGSRRSQRHPRLRLADLGEPTGASPGARCSPASRSPSLFALLLSRLTALQGALAAINDALAALEQRDAVRHRFRLRLSRRRAGPVRRVRPGRELRPRLPRPAAGAGDQRPVGAAVSLGRSCRGSCALFALAAAARRWGSAARWACRPRPTSSSAWWRRRW